MRRLMVTLLLIALLLGQIMPSAAQDDARWITHIVQPEENLFRIALHYNLAVDVVMAANGLTDANLVIAGQQLMIPLGAGALTGTVTNAPTTPIQTTVLGNTVMHTVATGDTLTQLATRYGVSVSALLSANTLAHSSALVPGQLLVIPLASSADLGLIGMTQAAATISTSPRPVPGAETGFTQPDLGLIGVEIPIPPAPPDDSNTVIGPAVVVESAAPTSDTEPTSAEVPAAATLDAVSTGVEVGAAPAGFAIPAAEQSFTGDAPADSSLDSDLDTAPESEPASVSDPASAPVIDLGILPVDSGALTTSDIVAVAEAASGTGIAPETSFTPLNQPDLGIIAPDAAWLAQTGVFSLGDGDLRAIYVKGLSQGNNPHAFAKIGDCNSEPPFFLAKFDRGEYNLGPYSRLQSVVDHFAGSFERQSMTAWTGNHVWALLDPTWANPAYCLAGETPLECEFRIQKPSVVLIRLGTNEANSPQLFEDNMRRVIAFALDHGTIPVLGTKADQLDGSDAINTIIRKLADEYKVPLWDFGAAAAHIPARGLSADGFHMTYFAPDYTQPFALQSGHGLQNLTALMVLDAVWQQAMY